MSCTDGCINLKCRIGAWSAFSAVAVTLDDVVLGVGAEAFHHRHELRDEISYSIGILDYIFFDDIKFFELR